MDNVEYLAKLDELDHLLNDPEIDAEPSQIWSLLAEVSHHDLQGVAQNS
ncbi:peptide chain release factor 1 [Lichenicoccus sp.]